MINTPISYIDLTGFYKIALIISLVGMFGLTLMLWCVKDEIKAGIVSLFRRGDLSTKKQTRIRTKKDRLGTVFLLVLLIIGVCIAVFYGHKI
jgi:formate hydrogenlyase subunit 3/multisubunit Na+/H+ antiporter MnhD subunit